MHSLSTVLVSRAYLNMQPMGSHFLFGKSIRLYSSKESQPLPDIKKVSDIINVWENFRAEIHQKNITTHPRELNNGKIPGLYGFGFRGLKSNEYQLVPSAFRGPGVKMDEQSFYYGFRLIVTEPQKDHRSIFDWLTLMQHYDAPTRLLDWSENILKALFFVVEDPPTKEDFERKDPGKKTKEKISNGTIWVLDSYKLNKLTSIFDTATGVGVPETLNTLIRAEMTIHNDLRVLFRNKNVLHANSYDLPATDSLEEIFGRILKKHPPLKESNLTYEQFIDRLHSPFAVQAYRLNDRIRLQSGFFTIFGGKGTVLDKNQDKDNWAIGKYKDLKDLNNNLAEDQKFLKELCSIPAERKGELYNELLDLGINKATVYGDISNVSRYVVELVDRFDSANLGAKKT